jgi:hypothetical protein
LSFEVFGNNIGQVDAQIDPLTTKKKKRFQRKKNQKGKFLQCLSSLESEECERGVGWM